MRYCRRVCAASRTAIILAVPWLVLVAAGPLAAEWQSMGNVTPGAPEGNQISFRSPRGLVNISVLAPDLVRVRITSGASFGPDYSWAVIKPLADWPRTTVEFTTQDDDRIIRTSELEVRVRLRPFGLAFYDRAGHLISKDDDTHPTSWDGARVREWKSMPPDEHYFGLGEKAGPLDRRDHTYVMWNTDVYGLGCEFRSALRGCSVLHGPARWPSLRHLLRQHLSLIL